MKREDWEAARKDLPYALFAFFLAFDVMLALVLLGVIR